MGPTRYDLHMQFPNGQKFPWVNHCDKTEFGLRHLETMTNFNLRFEVSGLSKTERMVPAPLLVDSQALESKARRLIRRHVTGRVGAQAVDLVFAKDKT